MKEEKKKPRVLPRGKGKASKAFIEKSEIGNGENPWLQRAADRHPSTWSRGRVRSMRIPAHVYILIDKRTGEAYKTKSREMPFYTHVNGIKIALRNIAAYRDISDFKIVQYELIEKVVIDEL